MTAPPRRPAPGPRGRTRWCARATGLLTAAGLGVTGVVAGVAGAPTSVADDGATHLYLVSLNGPGTSAASNLVPPQVLEIAMLARQDDVLAAAGAPEPVYRWTTALNGFAVELTEAQATTVTAVPSVALVERSTVRPLAAAPAARDLAGPGVTGPRTGGAGVVVGVVDTGLAPDSPLFAALGDTGEPAGFDGACADAPGWDPAECNGKIVGARWFVDGFGADAVRATTSLSPRDDDGHGTQMASIAAGNAQVPVRLAGERMGRSGGLAPDARIAVYKACWSAPDPRDDGCATADLVTAVDRATRDGVDVLSLAVGGPPTLDTVERALLGAAEDGVVVVAAAGNTGPDGVAAHPSPWVTTVGGTTGQLRRGRVLLDGGPSLDGAMLSRRGLAASPVVLAADAPAAGYTAREARVCAPGSLDAARTADALVVCERGVVGRVDKSRAVRLAEGAGMVLVNNGPGAVDADVHAVPTVHLDATAGRRLERFLAGHPRARAALRPGGVTTRRARVAGFSPAGGLGTGVVKPDLVAPASGLLGAVPGGGEDGWDFVTGTSAATAYTAGVAATVLSLRDWSPAQVRSALVTSATPLPGGVLTGGSGLVDLDAALRPGLVYDEARGAYRTWLEGGRRDLNTPSLLLSGGDLTAERTVTNVGRRRLYFSSQAQGFRGDVRVTPAAVRLGPGESATFTVTATRRGARLDDGYVVWRGATGTTTRIRVVLAR